VHRALGSAQRSRVSGQAKRVAAQAHNSRCFFDTATSLGSQASFSSTFLLPRPGSALGFSAFAAVSVAAVFLHITLRLVPRPLHAAMAGRGFFSATHGFQRASLLSSLLACLTAAGASLSLFGLTFLGAALRGPGERLTISAQQPQRPALAQQPRASGRAQQPRLRASRAALGSSAPSRSRGRHTARRGLDWQRSGGALALCIAGRIAGPGQTRLSALSLSAAAHRISHLSSLSSLASLGLVSAQLSLFK
jgi:hypothetical protein